MANKDDYLNDYRQFFEHFAQTVNPNDQLPVKLGSYKLINVEVVGGIIDWTSQYLTQKNCPECLVPHLIKIVIEEMRKACKKQPIACGFNVNDNAYEPLKLMQTVMAKTNEICSRYLDNSVLCSLPSPGPPYFKVSVYALKNSRRKMEDRHVVIHDLNTMFNVQEASPSSFYGVYDGHAGHDAAAYSAAHLHQYLAESKHFVSNPEQALRDAFCKTDALFLEKCAVENLNSGTTAVCALLRPKEKTLYIAWAGDSLALLVNQGRILQCVNPHKPEREDERARIENNGGIIMMWGQWRVNGHLAVSRAIGDADYKPYVTAVPDVREIPLNGGEDFLIIACDGLWDFLTEDKAARTVYDLVCENPDDTDSISQYLVQLSKSNGSRDNISVIIVFLREPSKIASERAHWANRYGTNKTMDAGIDNANAAANNPFANSNCADILSTTTTTTTPASTDGYLLNLKHNGKEMMMMTDSDEPFNERTNGKRAADEFYDDDDLGPETDVDAVDDVVLLSPSIQAAKAISEGCIPDDSDYDDRNDNDGEEINLNENSSTGAAPTLHFDFEKKEEKKSDEEDEEDAEDVINHEEKETDDKEQREHAEVSREETPTPPVDEVQDVSGLVDNVAESGDDSEDEWNYYKAENKENINPDQEVANLTQSVPQLDSDDTMSQLNPNAAEFVPISPTRAMSPPICAALKSDSILAQSPQQPPKTELDINVPQLEEFVTEVKSRPSEVYSNGHQGDDNAQKLSSQEIMEKFLNGKNIDDIDFQPSTPTKMAYNPDEFHFGPNAAPFTSTNKVLDQSESLSTKAVCGGGDDTNLDESFTEIVMSVNNDPDESLVSGIRNLNKEQDPMSMSFYQDKDDDDNPFDLNKVHVLPTDLDAYLAQSNDEPIVGETDKKMETAAPLETTDLDKSLDHQEANEPQAINIENVELNAQVDVLEKPNQMESIDQPKDDLKTVLEQQFIDEGKLSPRDNLEVNDDDGWQSNKSPRSPISCDDVSNEEEASRSPMLLSPEPELLLPTKTDDNELMMAKTPEPTTDELNLVCGIPQKEDVVEDLKASEIEVNTIAMQDREVKEVACELKEQTSPALVCEMKDNRLEFDSELVGENENDPEPACQLKEHCHPESVCQLEKETVTINESPLLVVEEEVRSSSQASARTSSPLPDQAIENDYCKSPALSQRTDESAASPFIAETEHNADEEVLKFSPTPDLLESPHEDVTSSVKDDSVSPVASPMHELKSDNIGKEATTPVVSPVLGDREIVEDDFEKSSSSPIPASREEVHVEVHEIASPVVEEENTFVCEFAPTAHPTFESADNYSEEISKALEDTIPSAPIEVKNDVMREPESVQSPESIISERSVSTTEVNSFLERSGIPDVTSPLMSPESANIMIDQAVAEIMCAMKKDEKHDAVLPPSITAASPSVAVESVPAAVECAPVSVSPTIELPPLVNEPAVTPESAPASAVKSAEVLPKSVAAKASDTCKPATAEKKPTKPKTSLTPKRPAAKATTPSARTSTSTTAKPPTSTATTKTATKSSTTPVGRTITKTPSKATSTSRTTTAATTPTSPTKAATPSRLLVAKSPKPTTITKSAEKKPIANGDVKAKTPTVAARSPMKPAASLAAKPATTMRLNLSKPKATSPSTTRTTTTTATASRTTTMKSAATTKSSTLTSKPTTTARPTTKTSSSSLGTRTNNLSRPKSAPTAPIARAKPAPITKALPDAQKQIKENANKLTASKTSSLRISATKNGLATTTVKKTETKASPSTTRTNLTKTTTSTAAKAAKKPTEIGRSNNNPAMKVKTTTTKVTSAVKPPPPSSVVNGINESQNMSTTTTTTVIETITISSNGIEEPQLMKDNSPVVENIIIDNSQLPETQVAD